MESAEICQMKGDGYCPKSLEEINIFKNKWTLPLFVTIGNFRNIRFNQLLKKMGGISPKVLSERLSDLEANSVISKKVYSESTPHVEYNLTGNGVELYKKLKHLTGD